ncbi:hypothetical protein CDAR_210701 [Caerostris darwini]|uniref:Uncharacterized protein n=1 Tax=Caerostris darwini TaxID=1538125 RepID=A0AAV4VQN9_9ARAC|nr:hypothetical protein CDAR_210701 [Caerostris darwini]
MNIQYASLLGRIIVTTCGDNIAVGTFGNYAPSLATSGNYVPSDAPSGNSSHFDATSVNSALSDVTRLMLPAARSGEESLAGKRDNLQLQTITNIPHDFSHHPTLFLIVPRLHLIRHPRAWSLAGGRISVTGFIVGENSEETFSHFAERAKRRSLAGLRANSVLPSVATRAQVVVDSWAHAPSHQDYLTTISHSQITEKMTPPLSHTYNYPHPHHYIKNYI